MKNAWCKLWEFSDKGSSLCLEPLYNLVGKQNIKTAIENLLAISFSWISVTEKSSVPFKRKGITKDGIVTWIYFGASWKLDQKEINWWRDYIITDGDYWLGGGKYLIVWATALALLKRTSQICCMGYVVWDMSKCTW